MIDFILDILQKLFRIKEPHKTFLKRSVPGKLNFTFCFGGMAFTAFLLSVMTGLLLAVYYVPSEKEAYQSIAAIHNEVWGGWLIRSVHKWSANLLIILIILHTIRVLAYRAYRPPREVNWIAGVLAFITVMASGFTGYLLPWDQKAYWATNVGTGIAGQVPWLGPIIQKILVGGSTIGALTLVRFFTFHVAIVPPLIIALAGIHIFMVVKQGISAPPGKIKE